MKAASAIVAASFSLALFAQRCPEDQLVPIIQTANHSFVVDCGEVIRGTKILLCVVLTNTGSTRTHVSHPLPAAATSDECFWMNQVEIDLEPNEVKSFILFTNTNSLRGPIQRTLDFICDPPCSLEITAYRIGSK